LPAPGRTLRRPWVDLHADLDCRGWVGLGQRLSERSGVLGGDMVVVLAELEGDGQVAAVALKVAGRVELVSEPLRVAVGLALVDEPGGIGKFAHVWARPIRGRSHRGDPANPIVDAGQRDGDIATHRDTPG
jgi:hypothetical protein